MPFARFEGMRALRYLRARRAEGFISIIAWFSLAGIGLGVATLIIVMSVMNGFRAELLGRIIGLNGHLQVQSARERVLTDFDVRAEKLRPLPGVVRVAPIIEGQVMATANGTMWVFGENVITGFSLKTLKQTTTVRIPGFGGASGWAGVVNVNGTLWLSNYVASVMAFNPATRTVTTQGYWSNSDFAGGITSANGSLWVADGSTYAFPLGFGVTRITPTPAPAPAA